MPGDVRNEYERGRFEELILQRLDQLHGMGLEIKKCQEDQGKRLTYLEKKEVQLKATCTATAAIFSIAIHFVMKALKP